MAAKLGKLEQRMAAAPESKGNMMLSRTERIRQKNHAALSRRLEHLTTDKEKAQGKALATAKAVAASLSAKRSTSKPSAEARLKCLKIGQAIIAARVAKQ